MKLQKKQRRERALARFHIQSETEWNNGRRGDKLIAGTYADYVARKEEELASLRRVQL